MHGPYEYIEMRNELSAQLAANDDMRAKLDKERARIITCLAQVELELQHMGANQLVHQLSSS